MQSLGFSEAEASSLIAYLSSDRVLPLAGWTAGELARLLALRERVGRSSR